MSDEYPPKIDFSQPPSSPRWFSCYDEGYKKALDELVERNHAFQDQLTKEQLMEAVKQALICGDFLRHVRVDNQAQSVSYLPYRREQELLAQIKEWKKRLEDLLDQDPREDYD